MRCQCQCFRVRRRAEAASFPAAAAAGSPPEVAGQVERPSGHQFNFKDRPAIQFQVQTSSSTSRAAMSNRASNQFGTACTTSSVVSLQFGTRSKLKSICSFRHCCPAGSPCVRVNLRWVPQGASSRYASCRAATRTLKPAAKPGATTRAGAAAGRVAHQGGLKFRVCHPLPSGGAHTHTCSPHSTHSPQRLSHFVPRASPQHMRWCTQVRTCIALWSRGWGMARPLVLGLVQH